MPSPVGHALAGLCGFVLVQQYMAPRQRAWLLVGSLLIVNLPDLDTVLGLSLGDPRLFHRQGTHSLVAGVICGFLTGGLAKWWKLNGIRWGIWGGGLYLSHVFLDLLVNDPVLPLGVQVFWPFSEAYFIAPVTPFARFDYADPTIGMMKTVLSIHNLDTVLREVMLVVPFIGLAWYLGRNRNSPERRCEKKHSAAVQHII